MAANLKEESIVELQSFLDTKEADFGLNERARKLLSFICQQDEEGYRVLSNVIVQPKYANNDLSDQVAAAARSYRAMTILKQDLAPPPAANPYYMSFMSSANEPMIITQPDQAGLLAKQLLVALANKEQPSYTVVHIREVLALLIERFPQKVLASAASGGKQGLQEHLAPLLYNPITLSILTNLVCYGCTGRRGMPSAEKSQAAAMQAMQQQQGGQIAAGARKKFVRQMAEFQLFDRLAQSLKEEEASGEEVCDAILTILEVVGYPPEDPQGAGNNTSAAATANNNNKNSTTAPSAPQVGENLLFGPLTSTKWWKDLLECLELETRMAKKESIARTLHSAFALATGNSSRILKSHAPARDATDDVQQQQGGEDVKEEEEEEHIINRLVEWELTDQMHAALLKQLPLLLRTLNLPRSDILNYHATDVEEKKIHDATKNASEAPTTSDNNNNNKNTIRHPGRYRTVPMGSWRVQLLSLLKEMICYNNTTASGTGKPSQSMQAMDALMEFPLAPELLKSKKQKKKAEEESKSAEDTKEEEEPTEENTTVYNPWPALCSLVFAYPYNDFYHNIFYQMLQTVVLQHHEPTLRVIFQKSKFLTRALRSLSESSALKGLILQVLNLLRLRSHSLAPNAFLHQYLASHDLWKEDSDRLIELTLYQQKPIKQVPGVVPLLTSSETPTLEDIELGSEFANKLGLSGISKWDGSSMAEAEEQTASKSGEVGNNNNNGQPGSSAEQQDGGGKKKKKNNKKKKKKK